MSSASGKFKGSLGMMSEVPQTNSNLQSGHLNQQEPGTDIVRKRRDVTVGARREFRVQSCLNQNGYRAMDFGPEIV